MKTLRRVTSLVLFFLAIYFVARSDVMVIPDAVNQVVPDWMTRAPLPIACFSSTSQVPCESFTAIWQLDERNWAVPLIGPPTRVRIYWKSFRDCRFDGTLPTSLQLTIGEFSCPNLANAWPFNAYQPVRSLEYLQPDDSWTVLPFQNGRWDWFTVVPDTWIPFDHTMTPVFHPPVPPIVGSPVIQQNQKRILGFLLPHRPTQAWFALLPGLMSGAHLSVRVDRVRFPDR